VIRQRAGLGKEILERRFLDNLGFRRSKSGIKVVVEKRPEINLGKRVLMVPVPNGMVRSG
jgi:hypothetical protein